MLQSRLDMGLLEAGGAGAGVRAAIGGGDHGDAGDAGGVGIEDEVQAASGGVVEPDLGRAIDSK